MIGIAGTFPLNGGRGRATLQCVWSIHRIDSQLGRLLDINSAWRDPIEQEKLYNSYRRYVNGTGPWAPIALPPEQSVHCKGEAIDTDDNNAAMTRVLNNNGWFHTVFRNGQLVEPWHYEYDSKRDKFFGQTASDGSTPFVPEAPKWRWKGIMELVISAPNGVVVHLYPGGRRNFASVQEYNTARDQIAFFRAQGNTTIMALPELGQVPKVTWDTHDYFCDYIGAPKK